MKRISILSALLLMCAMTFAQQALWGGAPVVSPEIHDNNTVTFRLKAPKAVTVQVTGDFLPTQKIKTPFGEFDGPGVADLKEGKDGVWEFTTPEPLKPELYSYTFLVDFGTGFLRLGHKTTHTGQLTDLVLRTTRSEEHTSELQSRI